jgi:hypothetical protein
MSYLNAVGKQHEPLSLEEIKRKAPSAFAIEPHSSRSARYTYIPTSNVIEGMIRSGFQPFSASQSSSRIEGKRDFTKHMIRFRRAGAVVSKVGDVIPEVVLINSHDGTSTYKLLAGLIRLACLNGLMVSDAELAALTIKHTGDILQNVVEGSARLIEDSAKVLDTVGNWQQLQLTNGEQLALAESARTLRFGDSEGKVDTPIKADALLVSRRHADNGSDLWSTFNRVQENVIKGGLRARRYDNGIRGRRVTTREVTGIDQDVKLNRALWQLAEAMAQLKGGK